MDHDFSCSLLAIDAKTGKIIWQFQELKKEIWDLDMVGPPILLDVALSGKKIPVVVALSKTGQIIMVDRLTGNSLYGFRRIKVPSFDIQGEIASEDQISITKPSPFSDIFFDMTADVTDLSTTKRNYVLHKIRNAKSGKYLPVSLNYDVVMYGLNGGAEWPGGAADVDAGVLFVPSNNYPFILRAHYKDKNPSKTISAVAQNDSYIKKCSICHSNDLSGSIDIGMGDKYNPPLIEITKKEMQII